MAACDFDELEGLGGKMMAQTVEQHPGGESRAADDARAPRLAETLPVDARRATPRAERRKAQTIQSYTQSRLTFDMRGSCRPQAGSCPLDGRVRRHGALPSLPSCLMAYLPSNRLQPCAASRPHLALRPATPCRPTASWRPAQ
jgi:hypothetical protein